MLLLFLSLSTRFPVYIGLLELRVLTYHSCQLSQLITIHFCLSLNDDTSSLPCVAVARVHLLSSLLDTDFLIVWEFCHQPHFLSLVWHWFQALNFKVGRELKDYAALSFLRSKKTENQSLAKFDHIYMMSYLHDVISINKTKALECMASGLFLNYASPCQNSFRKTLDPLWFLYAGNNSRGLS